MTLVYTAPLGLKVQKNNVSAQKIDNSSLKANDMVIATFHVIDELGYSCFFGKIFWLAEISMEVVFGIFFLILNNTNIQFAKKELN